MPGTANTLQIQLDKYKDAQRKLFAPLPGTPAPSAPQRIVLTLRILLARQDVEAQLRTTTFDTQSDDYSNQLKTLIELDQELQDRKDQITDWVSREQFESWRQTLPHTKGWWWSLDVLAARLSPFVTAVAGAFFLASLSLAVYLTQQINYIGLHNVVIANALMSACYSILVGTTFTSAGQHVWQNLLAKSHPSVRIVRMLSLWLSVAGMIVVAVLVWNLPRVLSSTVEGTARELQHQGRNKRAVELYERALEIFPGDVRTYYNLATAYDDDGRLGDAINAYQTVLKLADQNQTGGEEKALISTSLSRALVLQGQIDEARLVIESGLDQNPSADQQSLLLKNRSWANYKAAQMVKQNDSLTADQLGKAEHRLLLAALTDAQASRRLHPRRGAASCLEAMTQEALGSPLHANRAWDACSPESYADGEKEKIELSWLAQRAIRRAGQF